MSEPFIGEIRIIAFNFPPKGWAFCNGQTMSIAQNQALFSLFGTTYGGNGVTTFLLPNLQGRVPMHFSGQTPLGQAGGSETVTLTQQQIPAHNHVANAANAGGQTTDDPTGNYWGSLAAISEYRDAAAVKMNAGAISTIGGQPHSNMQPYLTLNFIVALQGIFPSRN